MARRVCRWRVALMVRLPPPAAMVKDSRITYRRRHSYNTKSNHIRVVKTPGAWRWRGGTLTGCAQRVWQWSWGLCVAAGQSTVRGALPAHSCVCGPGGRLVAQYVTKAAKGPQCGDCHTAIQGVRPPARRARSAVALLCLCLCFPCVSLWAIVVVAAAVGPWVVVPACDGGCVWGVQIPRARPFEYSRMARHERTVNRAYGGSRCAKCVRERILRAFIIEEQKIVKKVLAEKRALEKKERKEKQTAAAKLRGKGGKGKKAAGGKKPAAAKPKAAAKAK